METQQAILKLPANLYTDLQSLAAEKNTDSVGLISYSIAMIRRAIRHER